MLLPFHVCPVRLKCLAVCSGRVERLQRRGGLHLSSDELVDREVSNVFRSIAQQLRGQRTLYGTVMTRVRPSPSDQQAGVSHGSGFVFQAQDTFELIDADGSRALDHDEFREALRRMDLVRPTQLILSLVGVSCS